MRLTIKQALLRAQTLVGLSDSPRIDVEVILAWILQKDRSYLFTWPEHILSDQQEQDFDLAFARRLKGEPVAYIIGQKEFWSLPFFTDASTLIPRPETELLVELALQRIPDKPSSILDLGTGTGAIAIALATERPDCTLLGVDASEAAVSLARRNADHLKVCNVELAQSHWFSSVSGRYSLIVSNPPYIDAADHHLAEGDVRFEPRTALVADSHGLADIQKIVQQAQAYLHSEGWLLIEHGYDQAHSVQQLFEQAGFCGIATEQDYSGRDRVTLGQHQS
ncbi:Release factor glutamine methyltransferase [Thalassocella blandensis]|nr:Release factor glutamine methyltransferase [Thalassocella blandensis]